jgi:hypothetical protein
VRRRPAESSRTRSSVPRFAPVIVMVKFSPASGITGLKVAEMVPVADRNVIVCVIGVAVAA